MVPGLTFNALAQLKIEGYVFTSPVSKYFTSTFLLPPLILFDKFIPLFILFIFIYALWQEPFVS